MIAYLAIKSKKWYNPYKIKGGVVMCKPFVKWAGGKSQLLTEVRKFYPTSSSGITKYCEPFVGGGAVLFDIMSHIEFEEILINDINLDLIKTYNIIKNNVAELIINLSSIEKEFQEADSSKRKLIYTKYRKEFNKNKRTDLRTATLFIFLNKTCFNGLYRVNSKGEFNVPMGDYKNPCICDERNLTAISKALKNATIMSGDYKECLSFIDNKTFVYLDPPYRPLTETAKFTSYTKDGFSDKEQIELAEFCKHLKELGAKILISNSDPQNINSEDMFFDDLYDSFNIVRVLAKRYINCNSQKRGAVKELLISSDFN